MKVSKEDLLILKEIKEELHNLLGDVLADKKMYFVELHKKIEQYEIVCSLPFGFNDKDNKNILDYIGYIVQIRVGVGAFGSEICFMRKLDGELITWENQGFLGLSENQSKIANVIFQELIEEEKRNKHIGYTINGLNPKTGFIIEKSQDEKQNNSSSTIKITKKTEKGKEETIII